MTPIKTPKKLIEVALPLDKINEAAAREKSIRHGHPSTLHLWWARRPLAAARAVIFAQMVNDPGYERHLGRGVNKEKAAIERERLFKIIEDLVQWENTNNEEVLARAREEIWKSWRETCALNRHHPQAGELFNPDKLPAFHDPFAGGGSLPLEAQRLGLEAYASDLNPVAVTINKAMIEIPPRFAGRKPVGPLPPGERQAKLHEDWSGARGLAEDVRRYGAWMREEAQRRIGHLYPPVEITAELAADRPDLKPLVGQKLTVIAWLWARTVKSPNPAVSHVEVPLASTFILSSKPGKEAYVEPIILPSPSGRGAGGEGHYRFTVKVGKPPEEAKNGTKLARGANFRCLVSGTPIGDAYIKAESMAGRMGARLMAIVAEGPQGRVYLPPIETHEAVARSAQPTWKPDQPMNRDTRDLVSGRGYGFFTWADLFTPRQLVALTTFSDLVAEAIDKCRQDAIAAGLPDDGIGLDAGGTGALAYAQAVGVYLAFAVDKCADYWSGICSWHSSGEKMRNTFGRQAIPMVWDYAEANPFCDSSGNWMAMVDWTWKVLETVPARAGGAAAQDDAQSQSVSANKVVSTDPPYYDNIGYADLSDFFYVWLRRTLKPIFPGLYATLAVPKAEELVATPYRHGSKEAAERFFLEGMTRALENLARQAHPAFPVTIYYAFKQSETEQDGTTSTGWETFLEAVIRAGFAITGTWPMRTELGNRMIGSGTNALASSIVLVCRQRAADAPVVSRREFLRELNATLPEALAEMTRGGVNSPVAPVDLSQAIIGPGMAIFSQYAAVLEADGTPMRVKTALQLINRFLAEEDFDHDTQFCLHWFEQHGWATGKYGEADVLARAKGTSVGGLQEAGVVESRKGHLRLLRWAELPADWSPERDNRTPVWEALHQLIRALNQDGESTAGALLARMPDRAEPIRALAYRLYTLCERQGWAEDARAYNELVSAWSGIEQAAAEVGIKGAQAQLDI
jgi:putative DNA methylase